MACPKASQGPLAQELALTRRVLRLELQLAAYRELHAKELDELQAALADCEKRLLQWQSVEKDANPATETAAGATRPIGQP